MRTYDKPVNPVVFQSFGGGVQSVAMLIMNIRAGENFIPVFANVGSKAENPATLDYIEQYIKPECKRLWIPFIEVSGEDLYDSVENNPHPPIPVFAGSSQLARICTSDRKIKPVDRAVRKLLRQDENAALVQIGISLDELHRARFGGWSKKDIYGRYYGFWKKQVYPLIDMRITREDCKQIISEYGWSIPEKSSCWFCPFGAGRNARIERLENGINAARRVIGIDDIKIRKGSGEQAEECGGYCNT